MTLEFTNKQFRRLLDLVYIGNWILNSTRGDQRFADYDEVESLVFGKALVSGMPALAEVYEGEIVPSRAFAEGGIHEAIEQYEDVVFYEILAEELALRDAKIMALQSQINPHFLYNTLDAIGYMALTEEPSQTYEAIETLGSFYRQSLSQGDQMITVEKETAIVNDYVKLLRLRYGDLFDVEYQVDESCLRVLVPHLILQPLVENAVYHGIKPMGGNGHIRIRIGPEEGGRMKIQVQDNGVGIDASALSKLQDYHKIWNIDIDVSGTGIGLIGTIQRIVLIYGEQASYQIRSVPEGGTEITFLLPVTCGGEEDHGDWI